MKLSYLTNSQIHEVTGRFPNVEVDKCPTCLSERDEDGEYGHLAYKFEGDIHTCECEQQVLLTKHYLLANIPTQYHTLKWDRDFKGSKETSLAVQTYLENWDGYKRYGQGIEFGGTSQGVGKTFAATTIGKELVKRRESVYFIPFNQLLHAIRYEDNLILTKMNQVNVLILDELQPPPNDKLSSIYENHLESIVRDRTNYNLVTIMTTNMSEEDISTVYKRTYSLLSAKQLRVEMKGFDTRFDIGMRDLELIANKETRPVE